MDWDIIGRWDEGGGRSGRVGVRWVAVQGEADCGGGECCPQGGGTGATKEGNRQQMEKESVIQLTSPQEVWCGWRVSEQWQREQHGGAARGL